MRIGHSIDIHPFDENKDVLILGGVKIKHRGLRGHSDADVLLHVVAESILGALALGDMGKHFPNDENNLNRDSSFFVQKAVEMMKVHEYCICNIDCMILIEEPYLNKYVNSMRANIAVLLNITIDNVSVKCSTADKMGFIGEKQGVLATATVLLSKL